MTTAGFNRSADYLSRFSRASSAMYGGSRVNQFKPLTTNNRVNRPMGENNSEYGLSTDRYLPIIINLENQGLIDDHSSSAIKNMILEENVEVFRLINGFIAKMYDDQELCGKLVRLA
jgi:hypothetical protein